MAVNTRYKGKMTILWIVILSFLLTLSQISFSHAAERGVTIRIGKLNGYGEKFVKVDGQRIQLCKNAVILDDNDHPIPVEGLVATEKVRVKIKRGCAFEVKAILIRQ